MSTATCSKLGHLLKRTQKHMDTTSVTEKCNQPTAKPVLETNYKDEETKVWAPHKTKKRLI